MKNYFEQVSEQEQVGFIVKKAAQIYIHKDEIYTIAQGQTEMSIGYLFGPFDQWDFQSTEEKKKNQLFKYMQTKL